MRTPAGIDTLPGMIDDEAAGWIAALGLERGPGGEYVRSFDTPRLRMTYALWTADSRRLAGGAGDRLGFHHAGGVLQVDGSDGSDAVLLGPPDRFQRGVTRGSALRLVDGAWALITEIAAPEPLSGAADAVDRWRPAQDEVATATATAMSPGAALVARLGLAPHVEGGYFRELWAASGRVDTAAGPRPLASTIYYLLTSEAPLGRFHRNTSDITHLLHTGGPIVYSLISPEGAWKEVVLGRDPGAGQVLRFTCPGGWWKSSQLPVGALTGLISEIVAPGFDYADHQIADDALFTRLFPRLRPRWAGRVRTGEIGL
jgi:predicted cupin superfamily sugar epimerase